jgi:NAD(P)-dependent dehydrogenase (short-subunit alcohol dehydrogenase family)
MTDSAPLSPLHGKVALITGAGQGIGQGIAFSLAKRGVSIVAVGRTLSKCEKTVADIEARFNGKAVAIECDISNLDALDGLISDAVAAFGRLDILVNNAVTTSINTLMDTTLEDFEKGLRVGPMATLRLMQLAQPHLLEAGDGNIINLATAAAKRWDSSTYGVYAAEKEAIRALSRGAACEWGPLGLRTNCILPLAKSPALEMWEQWRPEEAAAFAETVPMKRIGHCEGRHWRVCCHALLARIALCEWTVHRHRWWPGQYGLRDSERVMASLILIDQLLYRCATVDTEQLTGNKRGAV